MFVSPCCSHLNFLQIKNFRKHIQLSNNVISAFSALSMSRLFKEFAQSALLQHIALDTSCIVVGSYEEKFINIEYFRELNGRQRLQNK